MPTTYSTCRIQRGLHQYEKRLTDTIELGDVKKWKELSDNRQPFFAKPRYGPDELRSLKDDFIMRQRVENAKALLRFTDLSLSEISYHLCFADQNHFQRVFRKYEGVTPMQYRKAPR